MILHPLRRAENIHWQSLDVTRKARAELKNQRPAVLWFTGLSGSGKSTVANLLEKKLHAAGRHTCILDGATASTETSASPTRTGSRTSGASPKWPS